MIWEKNRYNFNSDFFCKNFYENQVNGTANYVDWSINIHFRIGPGKDADILEGSKVDPVDFGRIGITQDIQ